MGHNTEAKRPTNQVLKNQSRATASRGVRSARAARSRGTGSSDGVRVGGGEAGADFKPPGGESGASGAWRSRHEPGSTTSPRSASGEEDPGPGARGARAEWRT